MFDEKFIKPQQGYGTLKGIKVFLYQLNQKDCPYIDNHNNCSIYEKRPLICQSYPVEPTILGGIVREDCPESSYYPKDGTAFTEAGLVFNEQLRTKMREFRVKGDILWFFDLYTNKWTIIPDTFSSQHISQFKERQKRKSKNYM